ncbi:MAG: endonuclease/exonuclease/phosphatase family protein, partial [Planctomycetota bacterium]
MASINIMFWNIQNFGSDSDYNKITRGPASTSLAQFIRKLISVRNTDILCVQEVLSTAGPHIEMVLHELWKDDPTWCCDWIPGAVKHRVPEHPDAVTSVEHLTWASGHLPGRSEGYAVFWRNGAGTFQMVQTQYPVSKGTMRKSGPAPAPAIDHVLGLSLVGRRVIPREAGVANIRSGEVAPSHLFSPAAGGYVAGTGGDWSVSRYPDVAATLQENVYWSSVRRPARFVIQTAGGAHESSKLVPVLFTHAPSGNIPARQHTYLSGIAQENYIIRSIGSPNTTNGPFIYHNTTIAEGDYNLDITLEVNNDYYTSYRNAMG